MANVLVTWETQDEVVPGAADINHFGIKITGTDGAVIDDASEPLDVRSHTFLNVPAGDFFVVAQSYNKDESASSAPPMSAPITVPAEPSAPVIVALTPTVNVTPPPPPPPPPPVP